MRAAERAAAALALFAAATLQAPSTEAATGTFRGVAAAEGLRVGVTAVGAPVTNNVVDGASPISQAAVDSTTGASALASVAYPGDVVVTTPGLLAGVSGGQLSGVPPYPLIATAGTTTTPEQKVEGPGSAMRAAAAGRRAEATARSGVAAGAAPAPAWAAASIAEADDAGAVTATATSEVTAVTVGPLTLGRVTARSAVRRAPGADPVRESSFAASGVAIGETAVALTPAGLVVAGTATPVSATPVQAVLDGAGVSVRPLAAENTSDGVISAGLVVTRTQPVPGAISPMTVTYTFGRASAAVSAAALEPIPSSDIATAPLPPPSFAEGTAGRDGTAAGSGDADGGMAGAGAGVGGAGGSGLAVGGTPLPATGAGTGPGGDTGTLGGSAVRSGAATGATGAAAPVLGTAQPVRRVGSRLFDLSTIYLLLVAGAATAGAVIQFMRHAGVRLWTSRPG